MFNAYCLSPWLGPSLAWVKKLPKEGKILEVFFPTDNSLYIIAFGTHIKTAEPIEMMTRVGRRYHVLDGAPNPPRKRGNVLEKT